MAASETTAVDVGGDGSGQRTTTMTTTDIVVNNVVCSFSTRCHLNLRKIAMQGIHVEYKKENSIVNMRLRKPYTTATVWSSGKITCVGARSEEDAYKAARRYCRLLQKMQFKVKLCNYRVVNVLATSTVPFTLDVARLANEYQKECSYEPELHPGATFKLKELRTTLKLFATGSITLTAPSVQTARQAVEQMYPLLEKFKHVSSMPPAQTAAQEAVVKPALANNHQQPTTTINSYHHLQFTSPSTNLTTVVAAAKTNDFSLNPSAVAMTTATATVSTAPPPITTDSSSLFSNNYNHLSHHSSHHLYHHTNDLLTSSLPSPFDHHDFYATPAPAAVTVTSNSAAGSSHLHSHHLHNHLHNLHTTNFYHQHSHSSAHQLFGGSASGSLTGSTGAATVVASSSQPNNWFYDNLIIEPVDDFLP